jgi:UDP-N-acetylglucosamine--N-acetylmuramyl-(pentapeptide) pyrophosphoryl-undecaprenol N-acetylglucosamine transferase
LKPALVFSKGGFVAVPVVFAARARGIPVIVHESDLTPGLANRLAIPFAKAVCASFPQTLEHLPKEKAVLTGAPIRAELFQGDRTKGDAFLGGAAAARTVDWPLDKPLLLIVGGSLGSRNLNKAVRAVLPDLLKRWRVAHLCGKDGLDAALNGVQGYRQMEYVSAEMPHVLAAADMILSRAGSNAIFEFLALQKPHLLVPLPLASSRGDQILNARAFAAEGYSRVLPEEEMGHARKPFPRWSAQGDGGHRALRFFEARSVIAKIYGWKSSRQSWICSCILTYTSPRSSRTTESGPTESFS